MDRFQILINQMDKISLAKASGRATARTNMTQPIYVPPQNIQYSVEFGKVGKIHSRAPHIIPNNINRPDIVERSLLQTSTRIVGSRAPRFGRNTWTRRCCPWVMIVLGVLVLIGIIVGIVTYLANQRKEGEDNIQNQEIQQKIEQIQGVNKENIRKEQLDNKRSIKSAVPLSNKEKQIKSSISQNAEDPVKETKIVFKKHKQQKPLTQRSSHFSPTTHNIESTSKQIVIVNPKALRIPYQRRSYKGITKQVIESQTHSNFQDQNELDEEEKNKNVPALKHMMRQQS